MTRPDAEDRVAVERLLYEYADRLDAGELTRFAELFSDGVWLGHRGYDAVLAWLRSNIHLYGGTPLTHHVVSNVTVDVDGDHARATSYLTVLQRAPGAQRLDAITTVRYEDLFARTPAGWVFRDRRRTRRLVGDNSGHRRRADDAGTARAPVPELSIADRIEIRDLVDRYAFAADRRDGDTIAGLFASDGVLQIFDNPASEATPIEVRDTPEKLAAGPERLDRYLATSNFVGQHVATPHGSGAQGLTYCVANHLHETDGKPMNYVVHVRYLDQYVRSSEGWRFSLRNVVFDFIEHRTIGGAVL